MGGGQVSEENGDKWNGRREEIHGLLSKAKTEPEFLDLSLRGVGLFALFWLGGKENVTGPTILGAVPRIMLSGGLASSVGSIYPRQWGTGSQGLGFLKEKKKF